jgi:hypothetical protein
VFDTAFGVSLLTIGITGKVSLGRVVMVERTLEHVGLLGRRQRNGERGAGVLATKSLGGPLAVGIARNDICYFLVVFLQDNKCLRFRCITRETCGYRLRSVRK